MSKTEWNTLEVRLQRLMAVLSDLEPVPEAWLQPKTEERTGGGSNDGELELLSCTSYRELVQYWRKAMKWTDGLDYALSVMLAAVASTKSIGDQLWIKVVSPASSGKTSLCEALSTAKKYVLAKSTLRGFHSGYDGGDGQDHSLISQLNGKTFITKDGDTLLQAPNRDQILSEARDLYDTVSRSSYRNKQSKDYAGVRMTWLLCGTSALRSLDSSELGQRFLDCLIMEGIDDDLEDEVIWRVANRAERNCSIEADGEMTTHQEPEMTLVMQLTGGYVEHLRQNTTDIMSTTIMDDDAKRQCARLGKFVAYMRARPSTKQDEHAEREFAARLVSQLVRLAKHLAVVLNSQRVSGEVMTRTKRVAMDTARGLTLEIVKHLYESGENGMETKTISHFSNRSDEKTRVIMKFLRQIQVAEVYQPIIKGVTHKAKWRLTPRLRALYEEVCL